MQKSKYMQTAWEWACSLAMSGAELLELLLRHRGFQMAVARRATQLLNLSLQQQDPVLKSMHLQTL